jgi:hypothetical protein
VWDNDDTLSNFRLDWFRHELLPFFENGKKSYNEVFTSNNPYQFFFIYKEELIESMIDFKKNKYELISINREILKWFIRCGDRFNHILITDVSREIFYESIYPIVTNFGRWIHSYNFMTSNVKSDVNEYISKTEFIYKNFKDVDIFIDDNEIECERVKKLGITTFCVKQPWNNGKQIKSILEDINSV